MPNYLSLFCEIDRDVLMTSDYNGISLPSLYQQIFNINIEEVVKDKKSTVSYNGKVYSMDDVNINTFGKSYLADLKRQLLSDGQINEKQYCLYLLACGLSEIPSGEDVDDIYQDLQSQNWMKVIPQSFFLRRLGEKSRIKRVLILIGYMYPLKMTTLKILFYLRRLVKLEKRGLPLIYAKGLTLV